MQRLQIDLALFLVLIFSNVALADTQGIRVEVKNESHNNVKVTLTAIVITGDIVIVKDVTPGATVVFSKSETAAAMDDAFIGWTLHTEGHCSEEIVYEKNACVDSSMRCRHHKFDNLGQCSFKLIIEDHEL